MISDLYNCPQCGKLMDITITPTLIDGKYQKKLECKEHGRIFGFIERASDISDEYERPKFLSTVNKLICMACNAVGVSKLFASKDGEMICERCKDNKHKEQEVAAETQHMREICVE